MHAAHDHELADVGEVLHRALPVARERPHHAAQQPPLGLKAAYAWVAHRRGEPVPVYPKPEGVHAKPGCWQRRHEARLLTEDHKRYAAADAYATGALFCEYLRLQAEGGAAVGAHGQPAPV